VGGEGGTTQSTDIDVRMSRSAFFSSQYPLEKMTYSKTNPDPGKKIITLYDANVVHLPAIGILFIQVSPETGFYFMV
jgi:hypothetical protein